MINHRYKTDKAIMRALLFLIRLQEGEIKNIEYRDHCGSPDSPERGEMNELINMLEEELKRPNPDPDDDVGGY